MNLQTAKFLLNKTKEDYECIAESFSHTRKYLWADFKEFEKYIQDKNYILDLGCGNGRLFEMFNNKKINYTGVDNCKKLIKEAKNKYSLLGASFLVADALDAPFGDQKFDAVFCIAVLNHIPSKELRIEFLKNAKKILKNNGILIMTNWNLYQKKYFMLVIKSFFIKIVSYLIYWLKTFGLPARKLDFSDIFIPWKLKNKIIQRYYHAFTTRELFKLFEQTGFNVIQKYYTKNGKKINWWRGYNIVFICKKA